MNNILKTYKILEPIVVGFLRINDSYECLVRPGPDYIIFDGKNISVMAVDRNQLFESNTANHAIEL